MVKSDKKVFFYLVIYKREKERQIENKTATSCKYFFNLLKTKLTVNIVDYSK